MIAYHIDHWRKYHLLDEKRTDKTLCGLFVPKEYARIEQALLVSEYTTKLCAHCLRERRKGGGQGLNPRYKEDRMKFLIEIESIESEEHPRNKKDGRL